MTHGFIPPFTSARLSLRAVTPADRADLLALEADPEVMRFLNGGESVPEEGLANADFLTPRGTEPEVLAAHAKDSGAFVGWFALFDDGWLNGVRTAELGYRLCRQSWGKGYATEGALALVALALGPMGFERVRAQTMAENLASRRVLEKAGFGLLETVCPTFICTMPSTDQGELIYETRPREAQF